MSDGVSEIEEPVAELRHPDQGTLFWVLTSRVPVVGELYVRWKWWKYFRSLEREDKGKRG